MHTNSLPHKRTQPTYVVSMVAADGGSYFMYMADNWVHGGPKGLVDASYVWLPIRFVTLLPISIPIPKLCWLLSSRHGPLSD